MGRWKLALGAAVLSGSLVASALSASAAPSTKSPLQQGLSYYKGKTLTFISQGAAGGNLDLWARVMAPYIAAYLHATINVEDISAGDGIPAQDTIAAANPNGLTIGWISLVSDIGDTLTNTPGLNFNPARLVFLGGSGAIPSAFIGSTTSPYTSWAAVQNSPTPVKVLDNVSGAGDFWTHAVLGVLGVKYQLVTGYGNNAAMVAGFNRGDGPVTYFPLSDSAPLVQGGKARGLLLLTEPPKGSSVASVFAGVPTLAQILKRYPPATKKARQAAAALLTLAVGLNPPVLGAATATPVPEVDALRAAFHSAAVSPSCAQAMLAEGLAPGYIPGAQVKHDYLFALNLGKSLVSYLGPNP